MIVQDGMNVKANLNTNVACPASGTDSCPATNFEQAGAVMPPVQHGNCDVNLTDDLGVRGSRRPPGTTSPQSQPTVDPYVNSSLSVAMGLAVTSAVDCGPGTSGSGDTEILIPAIRSGNQLPTVIPDAGAPGTGCDTCTSFATSFYIAHDYPGVGASVMFDPAALSEMELDQNQLNAAYVTATGYGYGTFNMRSSMSHAPSVTVGSNKYGQWEYSNQSGDWDTFPHFFPSVAACHARQPDALRNAGGGARRDGLQHLVFAWSHEHALQRRRELLGSRAGIFARRSGNPDAESIRSPGAPGGR